MTAPLLPYDVSGYELFCADLVDAGFSPQPSTARRSWIGPIRASLQPLTSARRMRIVFYDGWPYRYAHVEVPGLVHEHASHGLICLWAEDDPAQLAGRTLPGLWQRLDEWAATAATGFATADEALDAYMSFTGHAERFAEIDLPDLLRSATNGHVGAVHATLQGRALLMQREPADCALHGAFYFRTGIPHPPHDLAAFRGLLTRRQLQHFNGGLQRRRSVGENEPSGGHDHAVLAWPRHGHHDALVLSFSGTGDTLQARANPTSPADLNSRKQRAGGDLNVLAGKRALLAGVGAIGGQVAVTLASSGLSRLTVCDSDDLKTVNLVRHVSPQHYIGYPKVTSVAIRVDGTAPWCQVDAAPALSYDQAVLTGQIRGYDLIIDCTGISSMTSVLGHVCAAENVTLLTGALYLQGALLRIRRQGPDDTLLSHRADDPTYVRLPPDRLEPTARGFLELGCTAPVHNAAPVAVLRAAADVSAAAIDILTRRNHLPDEAVTVLRPLFQSPFDRTGTVLPPPGPHAAVAPPPAP